MKASFPQRWLNILCRKVAETQSAAFSMPVDNNQRLQTLAIWPENLPDVEDFDLIIKQTLTQNQPVSIPNVQQPDQSVSDYFAQPVYFKSELLGVIVFKVKHIPKEQHAEMFATLQQAAQWLELANTKDEHHSDHFSPVINLLAGCIEQKSYREMLIALVTELTQSLNCEHVAVGEFLSQLSTVVALSNSAQFDDRSNFMRKIADAMDEAIEQDSLIAFPGFHSNLIQRSHLELARRFGSGSVLTIPMINGETVFGAVTLLRSEEKPFDSETINLCKLSMSLLTPVLALKKADERGILAKIAQACKDNLAKVFGFKYLKTKLVITALVGLLAAAAFMKADYQLTADAVLEGKMQRVVSAPVDGFLLSASVRAGDTVKTGEVMATLNDDQLKLELSRLNGQLQKFRREYREALSANDLVKVRVISAQIDQAAAEMALTEQQLQKIALTAPFDSVVIEGDLSQMLGSPIQRGDTLFKIAPLEGYRIILKVDEHLISHVEAGQKGVLALSSIPDRKFDMTVEKITAVAKADDNLNIFRVEASLDHAPDLLRPGMEGIGKIKAGKRNLLWIWTHEMLDRLGLWLWSWWY